jgi:hypothetical protein
MCRNHVRFPHGYAMCRNHVRFPHGYAMCRNHVGFQHGYAMWRNHVGFQRGYNVDKVFYIKMDILFPKFLPISTYFLAGKIFLIFGFFLEQVETTNVDFFKTLPQVNIDFLF